MPMEKALHKEMSGYISNLLRQNVGKGPTSVFVTIKKPFIAIYLRGFLAPMERILLGQEESQRVLETRDLLINELSPEIKQKLWESAGLDVKDVYADWNLENETGIIIGITNDETEDTELHWPVDTDKKEFENKVNKASKQAEKKPASTESYWLNDRTILVKRKKILVEIEKALIKSGYSEVLKLAKRPLERELLKKAGIENSLKRDVLEIFLDWDFKCDKGYIVLIIEPAPKGNT